MSTSEGTGQWFGNHAAHNIVTSYRMLGTAAQGNYVKLVAKLSSFGSGWSMYLYDGLYESFFQFENGYTTYYTPGTPNATATDLVLSSQVFHTYEFWLQGDKVAYAVDGTVYYAGDALYAPAGQ